MTSQGFSRRAFLGMALTGAAVCAVGSPALAFATPSSEKQAEADAVKAKLAAYDDELAIASDNYKAALDEHDTAVAAMNEAQTRIDEAEAKIATLQVHLGTRCKSMYRNGSMSFLEVLLGAGTFEEFLTTWDVLNDLNQDDARYVQEMKAAKIEAQAAREEYSAQEKVAAEKLAEAERVKNEAEAIVNQYQAELDDLEAEVAALLDAEREPVTSASSNNDYSYSEPSVPANGDVVDYAYSRLGCWYVWAASGPNTFDCSGLTSWCYRQAGISIPRSSGSQRAGADAVLSVGDAEPGDILWKSGHVGIYIGGGAYIHAPTFGQQVCIAYNMGQWSCALRFW